MAVQTLMLNVPEPLYQRLQDRARRTNRTVEDETLGVLAEAVPAGEQLPQELEEAVAPLTLLDDESLWRAARNPLAEEATAALQELHHKEQREGLTDEEAQTRAALVRQYERALLVRARAAVLLKERGHDVAPLLAP